MFPQQQSQPPPPPPVVDGVPISAPDPCNLIVNYIPTPVTDEKLRELFAPFGTVVSARVIVDRFNNHPKGYGFVKYTTKEAAKNAIRSMNGFKIGNKHLRVTQANGPQNHYRPASYAEGPVSIQQGATVLSPAIGAPTQQVVHLVSAPNGTAPAQYTVFNNDPNATQFFYQAPPPPPPPATAAPGQQMYQAVFLAQPQTPQAQTVSYVTAPPQSVMYEVVNGQATGKTIMVPAFSAAPQAPQASHPPAGQETGMFTPFPRGGTNVYPSQVANCTSSGASGYTSSLSSQAITLSNVTAASTGAGMEAVAM